MAIGTGLWGQTMYEIVIARDDESGQYYVHDSDITGLEACADTLEALFAIIDDVAPELISFNHRPPQPILQKLAAAIASRPRTPKLHYNYTRELCVAAS